MEHVRLPLIDDLSAEFIKMLSVRVLEHVVIFVAMTICRDSELEYIWPENILV